MPRHKHLTFFRASRLAALFALLPLGGPVSAQYASESPSPASPAAASAAAPTAGSADSTPAPKRTWDIIPSVGLDVTHTDNVLLQPNGQSDTIFIVSPGIRINNYSARVRGSLDFRLQHVTYLEGNRGDRFQRSFNSNSTAELVDNWLFLDFAGRISRQSVSAFGPQSLNNYSVNSNVVETQNYMVSPYVRGRLANLVDYTVRYDLNKTSSASVALRDTTTHTLTTNLSGGTPLSRLNWGLNASSSTTEYSNGRSNEMDSMRASLNYLVDPQFKVILITGRESNDFVSFNKTSSSIDGYGFEWSPTVRTRMNFTKERRFFGDSHNFALTHRFTNSSLRYTSSRDIQLRPPQLSLNTQSLYDVVYDFYASEPDETTRRQLVEAFFAANPGIPREATISTGGTLNSSATLNSRREIAYMITGARNSVTFSANRGERSQVGTGVGIVDDFSLSQNIRTRGQSANWSYRLSPVSSITLMVSTLQTTGTGTTELFTRLNTNSLTYTSKLGAKTSGTLGVRRVRSTGNTGFNYVEHAVTGSLLYTF